MSREHSCCFRFLTNLRGLLEREYKTVPRVGDLLHLDRDPTSDHTNAHASPHAVEPTSSRVSSSIQERNSRQVVAEEESFASAVKGGRRTRAAKHARRAHLLVFLLLRKHGRLAGQRREEERVVVVVIVQKRGCGRSSDKALVVTRRNVFSSSPSRRLRMLAMMMLVSHEDDRRLAGLHDAARRDESRGLFITLLFLPRFFQRTILTLATSIARAVRSRNRAFDPSLALVYTMLGTPADDEEGHDRRRTRKV
jgi:hypothetical protein